MPLHASADLVPVMQRAVYRQAMRRAALDMRAAWSVGGLLNVALLRREDAIRWRDRANELPPTRWRLLAHRHDDHIRHRSVPGRVKDP